ncbi:MAG: hypothetical protein AB7U73_11485 [Pirellulales bacterium]
MTVLNYIFIAIGYLIQALLIALGVLLILHVVPYLRVYGKSFRLAEQRKPRYQFLTRKRCSSLLCLILSLAVTSTCIIQLMALKSRARAMHLAQSDGSRVEVRVRGADVQNESVSQALQEMEIVGPRITHPVLHRQFVVQITNGPEAIQLWVAPSSTDDDEYLVYDPEYPVLTNWAIGRITLARHPADIQCGGDAK